MLTLAISLKHSCTTQLLYIKMEDASSFFGLEHCRLAIGDAILSMGSSDCM